MKKKLLSLLLVLVMAATLLPTAAFAGNTTQVGLPDYLEPGRQVYTIDNYDPNTRDYGLYSLDAKFDPYGGDVDYPTRAHAGEWVTVWIYPANGYKIRSLSSWTRTARNGRTTATLPPSSSKCQRTTSTST